MGVADAARASTVTATGDVSAPDCAASAPEIMQPMQPASDKAASALIFASVPMLHM
jgi:hypothetical protein